MAMWPVRGSKREAPRRAHGHHKKREESHRSPDAPAQARRRRPTKHGLQSGCRALRACRRSRPNARTRPVPTSLVQGAAGKACGRCAATPSPVQEKQACKSRGLPFLSQIGPRSPAMVLALNPHGQRSPAKRLEAQSPILPTKPPAQMTNGHIYRRQSGRSDRQGFRSHPQSGANRSPPSSRTRAETRCSKTMRIGICGHRPTRRKDAASNTSCPVSMKRGESGRL